MKIQEVWEAIEAGKTVYANPAKSYKVYVSEIHADAHTKTKEYQTKHFSHKDGKVLSVRCISNYFGSLIDESELSSLFIE